MVITITLHLVFGMIVDAFKDLRIEKMDHEEDQENVCFICGLERSEYERYGNFDEHNEEAHSLWNYLFYIIYLREKFATAPNEFTEIETYIYNLYLAKNVEWFPLGGRSIEYENFLEVLHVSKETDDVDELLEMTEGIEKELRKLKGLKSMLEEANEKANNPKTTKSLPPKYDKSGERTPIGESSPFVRGFISANVNQVKSNPPPFPQNKTSIIGQIE